MQNIRYEKWRKKEKMVKFKLKVRQEREREWNERRQAKIMFGSPLVFSTRVAQSAYCAGVHATYDRKHWPDSIILVRHLLLGHYDKSPDYEKYLVILTIFFFFW